MSPRRRYFPTLALAAALALPSCGRSRQVPPVAIPAPVTAPESDPVDALERVVEIAIAQVRESAVALEYTATDAPTGARRVASGVVVSDEGEVLSVRIDPPSAAAPIVAKVASGRRLPARWVAADPETGLTLLRIEPGTARRATPSTRGARLGAPVLVIGNAFGLAHSVSRGYVAGLGRRLELGPRQLGGLIQIDAALHPGDSGAPLADLHGGWIGVVRSGLTAPDHDDDHDLGFAITATDALWVAGELRDRGRVDRAFLGVTMDKAGLDGSGPGAVLGRVLADSPAERAGLKAGDRVVAIDGTPILTPFDLTDRLDRTPADATVNLDLVAADAPISRVTRLVLRAARRPPLEPSRPARPRDKSRSDDPRPRRDLAETVDRLERRIRDLEAEKAEKSSAAQARRP